MRKYLLIYIVIFTAVFFYCSCNTNNGTAIKEGDGLFKLLSPEQTHIDFNDSLTEGLNTNVLLYEYFYNGGGVAVGDLNNDGLQDIYFSGNMADNKLYLNKGNMQFDNITAQAEVAGRPGPWKTGVTMADINGDGRLDIYVCHSGMLRAAKRANELFINIGNDTKGVPHFNEEAEQYGLADTGYSTQAYFFDYDRDGDLDMLLLHHNPHNLPVQDQAATAQLFNQPNPEIGVRLYKNEKNHFNDITSTSGINSS
ncbi:MAG TPA: VCBS repeat-containing protein, partial [Chitinophagaceae bacterium]|nr:VCBS repeat-containing protein [Chitinophagaceae bacterium]